MIEGAEYLQEVETAERVFGIWSRKHAGDSVFTMEAIEELIALAGNVGIRYRYVGDNKNSVGASWDEEGAFIGIPGESSHYPRQSATSRRYSAFGFPI